MLTLKYHHLPHPHQDILECRSPPLHDAAHRGPPDSFAQTPIPTPAFKQRPLFGEHTASRWSRPSLQEERPWKDQLRRFFRSAFRYLLDLMRRRERQIPALGSFEIRTPSTSSSW
jgi:hypothetical protein